MRVIACRAGAVPTLMPARRCTLLVLTRGVALTRGAALVR